MTNAVMKKSNLADKVEHIADNFDHNIDTIDRKHTFHGMGIVSATTDSFGRDIKPRELTITRHKLFKIAQYIGLSNKGLYVYAQAA